MSLTPEERSQYRSKRLREGKNRPVSPARATPEMEVPAAADVNSWSCGCGTLVVGNEADFKEHRRICHEPPMRDIVEPKW